MNVRQELEAQKIHQEEAERLAAIRKARNTALQTERMRKLGYGITIERKTARRPAGGTQ